ncbi:MAG: hypothetical protein WC045_03400 [Patescibacteria group bacterium]
MSSILFERIFRELNKGEFDIVVSSRTRNEGGYIDYENNAIVLNPYMFPMDETLVHEMLHVLKPDLDESTIIEISSLLYEKLDTYKRNRLNSYIKSMTIQSVGIRKSQWMKQLTA